MNNPTVITSLAVSPDGTKVVSGSKDGTIRLWDAANGNFRFVESPLMGHSIITSISFSADTKHVVSGSGDGTICVWDPASGYPLGELLEGHNDLVTSVAFTQDGKYIVSDSFNGRILAWDTARRQLVWPPKSLDISSRLCHDDIPLILEQGWFRNKSDRSLICCVPV